MLIEIVIIVFIDKKKDGTCECHYECFNV